MNQGVNGHHADANFKPSWVMLRTGDQNPRQSHGQNLIRHGVHVSERPDQRLLPIQRRVVWRRNGRKLLVDPANEIASRNVSHEQEQTVGHLVKSAISQDVGRQWAIIEMIRLGACPAGLVVAALTELPVARQFITAWSRTSAELRVDATPGRGAVPLHVVMRNHVRRSLIAERNHQHVEQSGGVMFADGVKFVFVRKVRNDTWCTSKTTRSKNQLDRMSQRRRIAFCCLLRLQDLFAFYCCSFLPHSIATSRRCTSLSPSM